MLPIMATRTRVPLGRREDLGADCAKCFGLCCVALAFSASSDFPADKAAGEPCHNLDDRDGCRIHATLQRDGFAGCTVFDCFGAGQKVSRRTFGGRSWRQDPGVRESMFAVFPVVRRLHELLWYLDVALALPGSPVEDLLQRFDRVRALSEGTPDALAALDVDGEYDDARPLLLAASAAARRGRASPALPDLARPGVDLAGARLAGADLRGAELRGAVLIGADLRGADLRWCDVLGADLRGAELSGATLEQAIYLTQMQVNGARGDAATRLPEGFSRPRQWM